MLGFHSISAAPISASADSKQVLAGSITLNVTTTATFKEIDRSTFATTFTATVDSSVQKVSRTQILDSINTLLPAATGVKTRRQQILDTPFNTSVAVKFRISKTFTTTNTLAISSTIVHKMYQEVQIQWHVNTETEVATRLFTVFYPGVQSDITVYSTPAATFRFAKRNDFTASFTSIPSSEYGLELTGDITNSAVPASVFDLNKKLNGSVTNTLGTNTLFKSRGKLTSNLTLTENVSSKLSFKHPFPTTFTSTIAGQFEFDLLTDLTYSMAVASAFDKGVDFTATLVEGVASKISIGRLLTLSDTLGVAGKFSKKLNGAITNTLGFTAITSTNLRQFVELEWHVNTEAEVATHLFTISTVGITGNIQVTSTPSGAFNRVQEFEGTSNNYLDTSSIFEYNLRSDVIFLQSVASDIVKGQVFVGNSVAILTTNFEREFELAGSVTYLSTPESNFTRRFYYTGNIPVTINVSSLFEFDLAGNVTLTAVPNTIFGVDKEFVGDTYVYEIVTSEFELVKVLDGSITANLTSNAIITDRVYFTGNVTFGKIIIGGFGFGSYTNLEFVAGVAGQFEYDILTNIVNTLSPNSTFYQQWENTFSTTFNSTLNTNRVLGRKLEAVDTLSINGEFELLWEGFAEFQLLPNTITKSIEYDVFDTTFSTIPAASIDQNIRITTNLSYLESVSSLMKARDYFIGSATNTLSTSAVFDTVQRIVGSVTNTAIPTITSGRVAIFDTAVSLACNSITEVVQKKLGAVTLTSTPSLTSYGIREFIGITDLSVVVVAGYSFASTTNLNFVATLSTVFERNILTEFPLNLYPNANFRTIYETDLTVTFNSSNSATYKIEAPVELDTTFTLNAIGDFNKQLTLTGSSYHSLSANAIFDCIQYANFNVNFESIVDGSHAISKIFSTTTNLTTSTHIDYNIILDGLQSWTLLPTSGFKQIYEFTGYVGADVLVVAGYGFGSGTNLSFASTPASVFEYSILTDLNYVLAPTSNFKQVIERTHDTEFLVTSNSLLEFGRLFTVTYNAQIDSKFTLLLAGNVLNSSIPNSSIKQIVNRTYATNFLSTSAGEFGKGFTTTTTVTENVNSIFDIRQRFFGDSFAEAIPNITSKFGKSLSGNITFTSIINGTFTEIHNFVGTINFSLIPESILKTVQELLGDIDFVTAVEISAGQGAFGTITFPLTPTARFYRRLVDDGTRVVVICGKNRAVYIEMTTIIQNKSATQVIKHNATPFTITSINQATQLVYAPTKVQVITKGIAGPVGPAGPAGEEEMPYAKRVDFESSDTIIYQAWADPGSTNGSPVWRISKTTFLNAQGDSIVEWADGNSNFDNIWDNRASLSYS